jgi:hypothetical protein
MPAIVTKQRKKDILTLGFSAGRNKIEGEEMKT